MSDTQDVPQGVDSATPGPARIYDYLLGGTRNFPADQELAEKVKAGLPDVVDMAWANRDSHGRAAVWLAEQEAPYPGAERAVTYVGWWGAEDIAAADSDGSRAAYCGVARRP